MGVENSISDFRDGKTCNLHHSGMPILEKSSSSPNQIKLALPCVAIDHFQSKKKGDKKQESENEEKLLTGCYITPLFHSPRL